MSCLLSFYDPSSAVQSTLADRTSGGESQKVT